MAPLKFKDLVICFSGNFGPENPSNSIRRWTEHNGGKYETEISRETTHLVVSEPNWRRQGSEIRAANEYNTKIVTYDWFDDRLRLSGRIHEGKYLWNRIEEAAANEARKRRKIKERQKKREAKEAERKEKDSRRINWGAALFEHINEYDNDEAQHAHESQHALVFKQGAKDARKDTLSDNSHVHMDETGFEYSVKLTKVHPLLNRNSVVNISLYASNHIPEIYSLIVKTIGATKTDSAKVHSCIDVNYPTAFRAFRNAFKCYTGIDWEKRIAAFSGGSNPLNVRHTTPVASPRDKKNGTPKGRGKGNTSKIIESIEDKTQKSENEFAGMKYTYHLPGPREARGTMPDGSHLKKKVEQSVYERFGRAKDANVKKSRAPKIAKDKKLGKKNAPIVVLDDSDDSSSDDESVEEEDANHGTSGSQKTTAFDVVAAAEQPELNANIGAEEDDMQGVETSQGPVNSIFNNPATTTSVETQENSIFNSRSTSMGNHGNSIFNNPAAIANLFNNAPLSNRNNDTQHVSQPVYQPTYQFDQSTYQSEQLKLQPSYQPIYPTSQFHQSSFHSNQPNFQSNQSAYQANQPTYQPTYEFDKPAYQLGTQHAVTQPTYQSDQPDFQPDYQPTSPRYTSLSPEPTLGAFQTADVYPTINDGGDAENDTQMQEVQMGEDAIVDAEEEAEAEADTTAE